MCVVSMIGDHYNEKWKPIYNPPSYTIHTIEVSRAEFDALKKEVLEMKELLKRAKIYDEQNGEPNCGMEDKVALLRRIAEAVGVNLDDVLPAANTP